jgi:hypothetical protein
MLGSSSLRVVVLALGTFAALSFASVGCRKELPEKYPR